MVVGIVKQHQGWIDCISKVNEGACFDIYLPRWRPADGSQPHPPDAAASPRHGHETILLADDEPMIRSLSRAILESYGYKVLLAEDGAQAVKIYEREKQRIDLVILDLTMPELSGRDALRRLAGIDPRVPVLFASGYSAEDIAGLQHGPILGFIAKPYQPEELARTVRLALDNLGKASKITADSPTTF